MAREADLGTLVKAELASAKERLAAARLLLDKGKLPDAVNRIYYAAFHAARAVMTALGRPEAKTHSGLISEFSLWVVRPGILEARDASALRRSFEARETSDYTIAALFDREEGEGLLPDIETFL